MPLRRKSSSNRTDIIVNGIMDSVKQRSEVIQELDISTPSSQEKRRGSTKSASSVASSDGESSLRAGEVRGKKETPSKGIARSRKSSRDCVIPENIDLSPKLHISENTSPTFTIQDFSYDAPKTRPIMLQRIRSEECNCISIRDLSESPQRFGLCYDNRKDESCKSRLASSHDSDSEPVMFHPPSSPLLVAMRTAVDSLNQYEDFEILEEIGAGFFAKVFKVGYK